MKRNIFMEHPVNLTSSDTQKALTISVNDSVDLSAALQQLGLQSGHPTLVVLGGASKMSDRSRSQLSQLFVEVVAQLAQELGAYVVDGGTDSGVMQMMGQARDKIGATFPLIGVTPDGKVVRPDTLSPSSNEKLLEPNHTHHILIPGSNWGDESSWLARIATILAGDSPSIALLINGGEIALVDVSENVAEGRSVLVLAGSGRLADEIAQATRHPDQAARVLITQLVQTGQLTVFDLLQPLPTLNELLRQQLTAKGTKVNQEANVGAMNAPNIILLKNAWARQQTYSKNATAAQNRFNSLRLWILGLGLLATVLAVIHEEIKIQKIFVEKYPAVIHVVDLYLLIVPIIGSVLLAGAIKFDKGKSWILLRGSAEVLKREIYLYRAGIGNYSKNRDTEIAEKIKTFSDRLKGSAVHQFCFHPNEANFILNHDPSGNPDVKKDDKFSNLTPEKYLAWRLEEQYSRYRSKAKGLDKQLHLFQWGIYLLGGLGTFLVAINREIWVTVTGTLIATFTNFLEYRRIEATLISYNQSADSLYDIHVWWNSLADEEKRKSENFQLLVDSTEGIIQSENNSWMQDMEDRISKLYSQTDKNRDEPTKTQSIVSTEPINGKKIERVELSVGEK